MENLELKGREDKLKQSGARGMAQWVDVPAAEHEFHPWDIYNGRGEVAHLSVL